MNGEIANENVENHDREDVDSEIATGIDTEPLVDDTPTAVDESTSHTKSEEGIDNAEQLVENIESENDERLVDVPDVEPVEMPKHEQMETDEISDAQVDKYSELVDDTLENAISEREESEKSENNSVIEVEPREHDEEESVDEEIMEEEEMDEVG